MRRISYWMMCTVTVLVLLFSYHTSTSSTSTSAAAVAVAPGASTGSSGTAASGSSGGSALGSATGSGAAASGSGSSTGTGSGSSTGTGSGAATTYTGDVVSTRWGPVQVQITVQGTRITAATAVQVPNGNGRDQQINARAVPVLNTEVVSAQSATIDMVSGATVTSQGYLTSLQSAIDAAHL